MLHVRAGNTAQELLLLAYVVHAEAVAEQSAVRACLMEARRPPPGAGTYRGKSRHRV
jgi:hypothetical protein